MSPTISGVYWLKLNVENKVVWFKILWRNENQIYCIISQEKAILLKNNLNLALVKRGLAYIKPYDQRYSGIVLYNNLYNKLISCEKKAQKDRAGIWYTPSKWDVIKSNTQIYFSSIKNIINLFKFK